MYLFSIGLTNNAQINSIEVNEWLLVCWVNFPSPGQRCLWHVIKIRAWLNHVKQEKTYWNTIELLVPLEYISLFFRNALVGRPTEKLILRLKEKKNACVTSEGQSWMKKKGERVLHVQKHNKLRATALSDLETFNIKSVNKWNMPRVSDYHTEMHHLLFSKGTGSRLKYPTASIWFSVFY